MSYNSVCSENRWKGAIAGCYEPYTTAHHTVEYMLSAHSAIQDISFFFWSTRACLEQTLSRTLSGAIVGADGGEDESSSLLHPGRSANRVSEKQANIVKAILYAVQVFYSFFIM